MKKTISFILVALLLCGTMLLTACDSNSKAKKENEQKITEASTQPGEETTADTTGTTENPINPDDVAGSTGLSYQVNADGKTCTIIDIGTCTDTEITIPERIDGYTVTQIGSNAFFEAAITKIDIPDSITSIGFFAFAECTGLTEITIPDSVKTIDSRAFIQCRNLKTVVLGNGVTTVGESIFAECSALTSITLGNNLTEISEFAFDRCSALVEITIPDNVKSIGKYAFIECANLKTINLGNGVTSIGEFAFSGCKKIASITIPDSVTSLGDFVFASCTGLVNVNIGDHVESIGRWAFAATNLPSVVIPRSVKSIGDLTFGGDQTELKTVYYCGTASEWETINIHSDNLNLINATRYYYSASQPTTSGNYWRYVDGVPAAW
ncbi:MAG: leucine-rich repeat domain-containing protein [Ruminococcaceae bacterium]|nr:leucine-rich repeat domain-containing protein [Oscillospiraceae bacterium]